ncbi:MAG: SufS family cysteine desulfurase [Acidimicrobiia bacterium]|nr:SufS family cysteine desulfurase [Acidimicrobiia bacterium]
MTIDVAQVRKDFPTLQREVHGRRLVFLDSAASSQTPQSVIDRMTRYYEHSRSNVHRGVYTLAEEATDAYESGRDAIARLVNWQREGVVLTKNATEAMNLVAYAWVRRNLGPGDALLTTVMEHPANFVPWWFAARDLGFEVRVATIHEDGTLDLDDVRAKLADGKVKFAGFTHMSNVLGTLNPVADLVAMVKDANDSAKVLVDGSQAVPHLPVDATAIDADFYAFTGHKMLGPTGIGVLLGKPDLLEEMPPFLTGGEMILDVSVDGVTWNVPPTKFEAGTPMIAEGAGLAAAVEYLEAVGMDAVREHDKRMAGELVEALESIDGVTVQGPRDPELRGANVSFTVAGIHPHDIGQVLDRHGVAVRVGHHCAKPLMKHLCLNSTARASAHIYNDSDDLPALVEGIQAAQKLFAR